MAQSIIKTSLTMGITIALSGCNLPSKEEVIEQADQLSLEMLRQSLT